MLIPALFLHSVDGPEKAALCRCSIDSFGRLLRLITWIGETSSRKSTSLETPGHVCLHWNLVFGAGIVKSERGSILKLDRVAESRL